MKKILLIALFACSMLIAMSQARFEKVNFYGSICLKVSEDPRILKGARDTAIISSKTYAQPKDQNFLLLSEDEFPDGKPGMQNLFVHTQSDYWVLIRRQKTSDPITNVSLRDKWDKRGHERFAEITFLHSPKQEMKIN